MDVLTFISELTKALAQPLAVVTLVFLLRRPIMEVFPSLRRLKYKEIELEFAQEVSELKAEVEAIAEEKGEEAPSITSSLLNLVSYSTRAAIMEAWLEVEFSSISVASSFWGQPPSNVFKNMPKLGEYLL